MTWEQIKLGEIAQFRNGLNFTKDNFGKGLKVINVGDFQNYFKVRLNELEEINPDGIVREESYLKNGDIVFVRSNGNRELIGRSLFIENLNELVSHSAFTIKARFISNQVFPKFYAYLFRSSLIRQTLSAQGNGTNISNLNQTILNNLDVPFPPLKTQKQIASILSAYDDLIENNTRRIAILEETARRIYEEWFVNFRFPGHEKIKLVESELGSIPENWNVDTVGNVIKRFPSGKKFDQKTAKSIGQIPILDQGKSGVIGYHDEEPSVYASLDDPIIVFANHTCYQRIIFFPFSAIQNVIPYKSSENYPRNIFWLYIATKGLVTFNDYKGHFPQFAAMKIFIPTTELAEKFGTLIKPFYSEIYCLTRKNEILSKTRDLLLPKLISGEAVVSHFPEPETI